MPRQCCSRADRSCTQTSWSEWSCRNSNPGYSWTRFYVTIGVPSARLGGLYGLYFAIVAQRRLVWSFFSVPGFSASEIGIAIGVLTGSKVVAPYLWGTLGDLVPNRLRQCKSGSSAQHLRPGYCYSMSISSVLCALRCVLERDHRSI